MSAPMDADFELALGHLEALGLAEDAWYLRGVWDGLVGGQRRPSRESVRRSVGAAAGPSATGVRGRPPGRGRLRLRREVVLAGRRDRAGAEGEVSVTRERLRIRDLLVAEGLVPHPADVDTSEAVRRSGWASLDVRYHFGTGRITVGDHDVLLVPAEEVPAALELLREHDMSWPPDRYAESLRARLEAALARAERAERATADLRAMLERLLRWYR